VAAALSKAGVTAAPAAPAPAAAPPVAEAPKAEVPKVEERAIASVKLISYPEGAKFNVLREVRKLKPGMNLMDSKKMVENLPQIILKNAPAKEVAVWKNGLEVAGATVEVV